MSLLDDADPTPSRTAESDDGDDDTARAAPRPRAEQGGTTARVEARQTTVPVDGEEVILESPDTTQPDDEGTWLTGTESYGRPRGTDAIQNRQIAQTSAFQSIVNGIAGQIIGGELAFEGDDEVLDSLSDAQQETVGDLRSLLRDVLEGPHVPDTSLDQLIVSAVEDMMGPGQAIWQTREPESGDLPVAALQTLDPLTIRHNIDKHGDFADPPYWQANSAFASGSVASLGNIDPVPLDHDDIIVMDYPYGTRSYRTYPVSPAWQVREWLEILANSTTHHNRYYDDNEIPAGLVQVVNASDDTVEKIRDQIQQSAADPRDVPIVGGEGGAQWIEMGGTAINLDIIEEQKWFFQMCLGALGLGKAEVGLIEDVNRANGEIEATRVYKRVAGPFIDQIASGLREVCDQFDTYRDLGRPFRPTIALSDPREERAKEERLREQLQAGAITPRQYARRTGDAEIAEDDDRWQVEVAGETINYGDHPQWVAKRLFSAAGAGLDTDEMPDDSPDDGEGGEQAFRNRATYEVGDETLDLTPPDYMVAAAEAGQDAKDEYPELSDCGTGVGDRRARQLIDDDAGPDVWPEIAAYLTSHYEDVESIDGDYSDWDEDAWTDGCGTVQYALWGGTGDGRARDKAQEYANAVARARDEEEPY